MPGVGLLIMSTSARYAQIHNEMHHLLEHGMEHKGHLRMTADELLARCILFRNALVALYISVMLLAAGGLLGALADQFLMEVSTIIVVILTGIGILCLVVASSFLIRESAHSLDIIQEHHQMICDIADEQKKQ